MQHVHQAHSMYAVPMAAMSHHDLIQQQQHHHHHQQQQQQYLHQLHQPPPPPGTRNRNHGHHDSMPSQMSSLASMTGTELIETKGAIMIDEEALNLKSDNAAINDKELL